MSLHGQGHVLRGLHCWDHIQVKTVPADSKSTVLTVSHRRIANRAAGSPTSHRAAGSPASPGLQPTSGRGGAGGGTFRLGHSREGGREGDREREREKDLQAGPQYVVEGCGPGPRVGPTRVRLSLQRSFQCKRSGKGQAFNVRGGGVVWLRR